jgi:Spy/CpxP family protein refolding chaperone
MWMVLLTVSGFVLGGLVTYFFIPSEGNGLVRPPWSPRIEMRQDGERGRNQENSAVDPEKEAEKRTRLVNMWKDKLDLSEEQAAQFHLIFEAGHDKFIAASESSRERFAQIRRETDEELSKVLNPEQVTRYKEIIEEYRIRKEQRKQQDHPREENR